MPWPFLVLGLAPQWLLPGSWAFEAVSWSCKLDEFLTKFNLDPSWGASWDLNSSCRLLCTEHRIAATESNRRLAGVVGAFGCLQPLQRVLAESRLHALRATCKRPKRSSRPQTLNPNSLVLLRLPSSPNRSLQPDASTVHF